MPHSNASFIHSWLVKLYISYTRSACNTKFQTSLRVVKARAICTSHHNLCIALHYVFHHTIKMVIKLHIFVVFVPSSSMSSIFILDMCQYLIM